MEIQGAARKEEVRVRVRLDPREVSEFLAVDEIKSAVSETEKFFRSCRGVNG